MRRLASLALLSALCTTPALAFNNEYRVGPWGLSRGHGELVRRAAAGTEFEPLAEALVQGQRELDFPGAAPGALDLGPADGWRILVAGLEPAEQKKHFLRWYSGLPAWRAQTRPLDKDWAEAVGYMAAELRAAYRAPRGQEGLPLGHALHCLQDSFSPAHVERAPDGRIRSIAYYPARDGHGLVDDRDRIVTPAGDLTPEAQAAVSASHDLLVGFARWRTADEAAFERWLEGFTARHFSLETPEARR